MDRATELMVEKAYQDRQRRNAKRGSKERRAADAAFRAAEKQLRHLQKTGEEGPPVPDRTATVSARPVSPVASPSGPTCPKCGGTQFLARRSAGKRAAITAGAGAAVAVSAGILAVPLAFTRKNRLECVVCGAVYRR